MEKLYNQLCATAEEAAKAYYEKDAPIMTDAEYDGILKQIEEIEKQHPEFKRPDSLTVRVGGKATEGFRKVKHQKKILSLKNAYNNEDLEAFFASLPENAPDVMFSVQPKYDGLTLVCRYENGKLVQAVTRGDGMVGEDVTENAKNIMGLPLEMLSKELPEAQNTVWVRGEVLMYKYAFEELNKQLEANGQPKMANERNAAAGSLRQKDPKVTWSRKLQAVFYEIWDESDYLYQTEEDMLCQLQYLGFQSAHRDAMTVPMKALEGSNALDVKTAIQYILEHRDDYPFRIDGAVVKLNDKFEQEEIGNAEKYPKWAVAWKFEQPQYLTNLYNVDWAVGRTGKITPVACFDPVVIDGTTVEYATLNNSDYIAGLGGLHDGDKILVYKAAEIIPQVASVETPNMEGWEFKPPTHCKSCQSKLVRDGANLWCPNELCPARLIEKIYYFASKPCMDINGVGHSLVEQLVLNKIITRPSDLYLLEKTDMMKLAGVQDKKAESVIKAIEESKMQPYERVICALGLPNVGTVMARELATRYPSISELVHARVDTLTKVRGMGDKTAMELFGYLGKPEVLAEIALLQVAGLNMEAAKPKVTSGKLQGKTFCITGRLVRPRAEYRQMILENGGGYSDTITTKVDYLVTGSDAGSKMAKATKLGIPTISEDALMRMLT